MIRFECGCIALSEEQVDGKYMLIYYCDQDPREGENEYAFGLRAQTSKTFEKISVEETAAIHRALGKLVDTGYMMRELGALLRHVVLEK